MLSAVELTDVARLATSSVALILDSEHAVLRLQDAKTRRFVIRSYYGPADGRQQERLFRLDKAVSGETLKHPGPMLARDTSHYEQLLDDGPCEFRSLMGAPLRQRGNVIGTLCIYDKVAADRFYAGRFNGDDLSVFTKYAHYVERAIEAAGARAHERQTRSVDEETGLASASYLRTRIREEIARAQGREDALCVARCRLENFDEIAGATGETHSRRVVQRTAEALSASVRDFDVVGRTARDEFTVLLPEPGSSPGDRVFNLARATADAIGKDEELNRPMRVALAFGYATYPSDGNDRERLLERAAEARIRMV
jgi:diguanylate cyclase (GGDEF)-like protein